MDYKIDEINANRRILESFDLTLEDYLKLDKDVRLAILRDYWNKKMNKEDSLSNRTLKTKVLSIIKRK